MVKILPAIPTASYAAPAINFADLADEYGGRLYRFCLKLTYCKEDAEDLFQETFERALTRLPKTGADPKSFLFSTAVFLWKSRKRKYARRARIAPAAPPDESLVSDTDTEAAVLAEESARIVRELVDALPDRYRFPIIMRYTAEMELSEISAALKLPIGTVKSRLHKARGMIEKGLVKIGYGQ